MKPPLLFGMLLMFPSLGGCETMAGLGKDIQSLVNRLKIQRVIQMIMNKRAKS
jgi:predicted small secreted protein